MRLILAIVFSIVITLWICRGLRWVNVEERGCIRPAIYIASMQAVLHIYDSLANWQCKQTCTICRPNCTMFLQRELSVNQGCIFFALVFFAFVFFALDFFALACGFFCGRCGHPAGCQRAPLNRSFQHQVLKNVNKICPGGAQKKTHNFDRKLIDKCEVLGVRNQGFSLKSCGNYRVGAFFAFFVKKWKIMKTDA